MTKDTNFPSEEFCKFNHLKMEQQLEDKVENKIQIMMDTLLDKIDESNLLTSRKIESYENLTNKKIDSYDEFIRKNSVSMGLMDETLKGIDNFIKNTNDFIKEMRGNGKPGIWENVRSLDKKFKIIVGILVILVVLQFGGSVYDTNKQKVKEELNHSTQGLQQYTPQNHISTPKDIQKDTVKKDNTIDIVP